MGGTLTFDGERVPLRPPYNLSTGYTSINGVTPNGVTPKWCHPGRPPATPLYDVTQVAEIQIHVQN